MLNKITKDIYKVEVPMPYNMGFVNSYLIKGEKGYTMIDTGDRTEEGKNLWKKVIASGIHIEKIVLTHAHPDHIGLVNWFQEQYNIPVWLSKKGYEELVRVRQTLFVDGEYTNTYASNLMQKHGGPSFDNKNIEYYNYEIYQFEPDKLFEKNEQIKLGDYYYETIWTPGHAIDHFCFYGQHNKVLIVGDLILNSMNPLIPPEIVDENPLNNYIESLDKIINYPANYILPGHGKLIPDLPLRINEVKKHYNKRFAEIEQIIDREGISTAYEVAEQIYDNPSMPAFLQIITNLVYLERVGAVRKDTEGRSVYFFENKTEELNIKAT